MNLGHFPQYQLLPKTVCLPSFSEIREWLYDDDIQSLALLKLESLLIFYFYKSIGFHLISFI